MKFKYLLVTFANIVLLTQLSTATALTLVNRANEDMDIELATVGGSSCGCVSSDIFGDFRRAGQTILSARLYTKPANGPIPSFTLFEGDTQNRELNVSEMCVYTKPRDHAYYDYPKTRIKFTLKSDNDEYSSRGCEIFFDNDEATAVGPGCEVVPDNSTREC